MSTATHAFYRVPKAAIHPGTTEADYDVRLLLDAGETYVVMAPEHRPAEAAAMGAVLLATAWEGLWGALPDAERAGVFLVRVKREDRMVAVRIADVLPGELVRSGPIPPTRYMGDPPPRPLRGISVGQVPEEGSEDA